MAARANFGSRPVGRSPAYTQEPAPAPGPNDDGRRDVRVFTATGSSMQDVAMRAAESAAKQIGRQFVYEVPVKGHPIPPPDVPLYDQLPPPRDIFEGIARRLLNLGQNKGHHS